MKKEEKGVLVLIRGTEAAPINTEFVENGVWFDVSANGDLVIYDIEVKTNETIGDAHWPVATFSHNYWLGAKRKTPKS